jgi:hypothetical protein
MKRLMVLWAVMCSMSAAQAATVSDCVGFTPPDPNFANVTCEDLCTATVDALGNVFVDCDMARAYQIPERGVCPEAGDPEMIVVSGPGGHDIVAMAWNSMVGPPFVPDPDFCCAIDADAGEVIVDVQAAGTCEDDTLFFECGTSAFNRRNCTVPAMMASPNGVPMTAVARGRDNRDFIYGSNQTSPLYVEVLRAGDSGDFSFNDEVQGLAGNDQLHGAFGDDSLYGGDGNDFIRDVFDGENFIDAGRGNDCVEAGIGDDVIIGGSGNDLLIGGGGTDDLQGSNHSDLLIGSDVAGVAGGTTLYDGDGTSNARDFVDAANTTIHADSDADGSPNTCDPTAAGMAGCTTVLGSSAAVRAAGLALITGRHPMCPL